MSDKTCPICATKEIQPAWATDVVTTPFPPVFGEDETKDIERMVTAFYTCVNKHTWGVAVYLEEKYEN